MMMEFYFNKEEIRKNHYDINKIYKVIDKHFEKYEEYGVKKIAEGVYQASDNQKTFEAFGLAVTRFPKTSWFLKVIEEWYWREEGDDIEDREDCLKSYYEVHERNKWRRNKKNKKSTQL